MRINFVENYENLSDNEIITLINDGRYELLEVIIKRYYPKILYYTKKYCSEEYREDAIQEANLAIYSAVRTFDSSKSSFSTFVCLCIKRAVIGVLKGTSRKKDIPCELLLSFDDAEIIDCNTPEKIFIEREDYNLLKDNIKLELSSLEYKVLQLHLCGETYNSISKILNIPEKSVDNALSRIRKKLLKTSK